MPIEYSIDEEKNLVCITASGKTTPLEWGKAFIEINGDTKRHRDMNVCFDVRRHESVIPSDSIESMSKRIEKKDKTVKWAFVVSRQISEEKVSSLAIELQKKNIAVKAFYDSHDADKWLSG
jgi:hypothetical protein